MPIDLSEFIEGNDKAVDEALCTIKNKIMHLQRANKALREENRQLKDAAYRDNELIKMKTELDNFKTEYYRGFPISKEDEKKIEEWKNKHERYAHMIRSIDDRLGTGGSIGGRYTYEFIPTSIGTIGVVKCHCGEQFVFRDIV